MSPEAQVSSELQAVLKQIEDHDEVLTIMRSKWDASKGLTRREWMEKIDRVLDDRSRLMAFRDQLKGGAA